MTRASVADLADAAGRRLANGFGETFDLLDRHALEVPVAAVEQSVVP